MAEGGNPEDIMDPDVGQGARSGWPQTSSRIRQQMQQELSQLVQQYLNTHPNGAAISPHITVGLPRGGAQPAHPHGHNHGHAHAHAHEHSHGEDRPAYRDAGQTVPSDQYVMEMPTAAPASQPVPDINQNGGGANIETPSSMSSLLSLLWHHMDGSVPFIVLLLAKVLYNHRWGIVIFGSMLGTFYHTNSCLKRQIGLMHRQDSLSWHESAGYLAWIILFLSGNIFFVYYVFDEQKLYMSLFFQLPAIEPIDFWNLLWILGMTDFVIKFGTMIIKALLAFVPPQILPYKKRGKHLMLIEHLSQSYRSVVPILPWLVYLVNNEHGGEYFSWLMLLLFCLCKFQHLRQKGKELLKAFKRFKLDVSYGTSPSRQDLDKVDNCCPICQDKYTVPVMLACKHIFCESCVALWFDREKTCPMCRAHIADNPEWRDGSTSATLQIF